MFNIKIIEEEDYILDFLLKRNLLNQYKKVKKNIIFWNTIQANLKFRKPKWLWILYFRINKQFRAYCYLEKEKLIVFKIDNHQNK